MKKLFTLLCFAIVGLSAKAQLPDGSIAPDFTATDINGNTWNLYELLDQGKTVIIDVSATWCGPCWVYHESGALENLYEEYGPNGTNEMFVFMIEGDDDTTLEDLYGTGSNTQGDWVTGTPYPIIDDGAWLGDLFEIAYYPTIYHICSNRIITEVPQLPTDEIYAMNVNCAVASGVNNAGVLKYTGFSGAFCQAQTFTPSALIQNLGTSTMTSATIELKINGNSVQTLDWAGNLSTYQLETVTFNDETISADATIQVIVTSVNGTTDDDATNNTATATATLSTAVANQNFLTLEIKTDNYPGETYWEIRSASGTAYYAGGNALVVGGVDNSGAYTGQLTSYTHDIALPADDCYEFAIYDSYGDGICCVEGSGYYKISDQNGNVLLEGGQFETEESAPFSLEGAGTIDNNASIVWYSGEGGSFCGTYTYSPSITLQNVGAVAITSATIEVTSPTGVLQTKQWTGNIAPGQVGFINLDPVSITGSVDPLTISIVSINGQPDDLVYKNSVSTSFNRNYTDNNELTLELQIDSYGYEIYWQLTNSAGDVMASGGNEVVGPTGGGQGGSSPGDPGAYGANEFIEQQITLPSDVNDCYDFLLVDSYGDGVVDGGGGYLLISDGNGEILVSKDLNDYRFTSDVTTLDVNPVASAVKDLDAVNSLSVFPNPVSSELNIRFSLTEATPLQVVVYNLLGQPIKVLADQNFTAGHQQLKLNVAEFASGLYYIQLSDGNGKLSQKFSVMNN